MPQGRFTKLGDESSVGTTNTKTKKTPSDILSKTGYGKDETTKINSRFDNQFTVEAWVIPDCGGVVVERDRQFILELGTVDTPGPAKFTVFLDTTDGTKAFTLTTASDATTRWSGVVYPEQDHGGLHDSYNRYDLSTYNDATNLNFNHRPLYHIVGAVSDSAISLFINGQVVISQSLPNDASITDSTAHVYIGGKGGDFRGAIESIHFATAFDEQVITPNVPMDDEGSSTALYRFEEPLDIIQEEYEFSAFTAASNGTTTTLTIPATDAQALIKRLTGKEYDSLFVQTNEHTQLMNGNQYLWRYMNGADVPNYHLTRIKWLEKALGKTYAKGMFERILQENKSANTYQMAMGIYCKYTNKRQTNKKHMRELAYYLLNIENCYRLKSAIAHFIPIKLLVSSVVGKRKLKAEFTNKD